MTDDTILDKITDMVLDLQKRENTTLPLLQKQLSDTERSIDNMLNAIQQGVLTSSTKQRLIDTFVNAIYLYDDRVVLTFNYKDETRTITISEIAETFGSDLSARGTVLATSRFLAQLLRTLMFSSAH